MSFTSTTINKIINGIKDNDYILPDIQRAYVWKMEQIEDLFDSLLRGYPIGSFLFWKIKSDKIKEYNFYTFIKDFNRQNAINPAINPSGSKSFTAILDGQQRLTSLYMGLYGSYTERKKGAKRTNPNPFITKYLYLNLLYNNKTDEESNVKKYGFKFLSKNEANEKPIDANNLWLKTNDLIEKDVTEFLIENDNIKKLSKEEQKNVSSLINHFQNKINEAQIINYYEENEQDLDKVLNIFVRVNSGGTQLSYSDLLMSTVTATWKDKNARDEIESIVDYINSLGFSITKDFIMKASLMLTDLDVKFMVKNFVKENMSKIEEDWENIKTYLTLAFSMLKNYGYSSEYITAYNAILPIVYYFKIANINQDNYLDTQKNEIEKIMRWIRIVFIKQIFGGSSDGTLTTYRHIIKKYFNSGFPIEEIEKEFKGKRQDISFSKEYIEDLIDNTSYSDKRMLFSVLSSVVDIPQIAGQVSIDHMYPKSSFSDNNILSWKLDKDKAQSFINNIANLQFLGINENKAKSAEQFHIWLKEKINKNKSYKEYNLIPDIKSYQPENFIDFCELRRKLMIEQLCKKLGI